MRAVLCLVLLALGGGAAACGSSEPLSITTIQVGRSLNSDDSVNQHTTTFKPDETLYVAAVNGAAGAGTLAVRWVFAGRTVREESKEVSFVREGATAFRLRPPPAGFPEGDYRVEVTLDGEPIGSRSFRVTR